jgi:hypothetical protein
VVERARVSSSLPEKFRVMGRASSGWFGVWVTGHDCGVETVQSAYSPGGRGVGDQGVRDLNPIKGSEILNDQDL